MGQILPFEADKPSLTTKQNVTFHSNRPTVLPGMVPVLPEGLGFGPGSIGVINGDLAADVCGPPT